MKLRSRSVRIALYSLAILLLLSAALHTPPVRTYALKKLSNALKAKAGVDLQAESLSYNLLTLSTELSGVELRSTDPANPAPFLRADKVRANVSFISLLKRKPIVEKATLEGLEVQIVSDSDGVDNLPGKTPDETESGEEDAASLFPLPFLIQDLRIRNADFLYRNDRQHLEIDLPSWSLKMHGNPSNWSQALDFLTDQPGAIALENRILPVRILDLGLELGPDRLRLEEFRLELGESRLKADGTLKDFDVPDLKSSLEAEADIGRILKFLGLAPYAEGRLEIETSVSGPPAKAVVQSRISGRNLSLNDISGLDVSASITWEEYEKRIRFDSLQFTSPNGTLTGKADLSYSAENEPSTASVQIDKFDLESITRNLLPFGMASRVSGECTALWPGMNISESETKADLRFEASRRDPIENILPVTADIKATLKGNRLEADLESGWALGLAFRGQIVLNSWNNIDGRLMVETAQLQSAVSALESFTGRKPGTLIGTPVQGSLTADTALAGSFDDLRISGDLSAADIAIGNLSHVNLQSKVAYAGDRIIIDSLESHWKDQSLTAEGTIDLGGDETYFDISAQVREGSLQAVAESLDSNWPVQGSFTVSVEASGTKEQIRMAAELSMDDLYVYAQNIKSVRLQANLNGRNIVMERFELEQAVDGNAMGRLTATGSYNLDTGRYVLNSRAAGLKFDFEEGKFPEIPEMRGMLNFDLSGSGTTDDPSMSADLQLENLEIKGRMFENPRASVKVQRRRANIAMRLPFYGLTSEAVINIAPPYFSRIETAIGTDLSKFDWRPFDDETLEGHIEATITGEGDLLNWREGKASLRATELRAAVRDLEVSNRSPIELSYENGRLAASSIELATGVNRFSLKGSLPLHAGTPEGALSVEGNLDLTALKTLFEEQQIRAEGMLRLSGFLRGSLSRLEPDLTLAISEGRLDHPSLRTSLKDINLQAAVERPAVRLTSFSSRFGDASIAATASIPLSSLTDYFNATGNGAAIPALLSVDVHDMDIRNLSAVPESIGGKVGFHLGGRTPDLKDFNALQATLEFDQFMVQSSDFRLYQATPVRLSISNGTLSIDHFLMSAPTTRVLAQGSIELTGDRAIDVQVKGALDIGTAALFSNNFNASGDSSFSFGMAGTISDPEISGFFDLQEGVFSMQTPSVYATDLNVRILVKPGSLKIEKFTGGLNGGNLTMDGGTRFAATGFEDTDINASFTDAFFNYPDGLRTRVSGNVQLKSQDEFMVLGGKVRILEGTYRKRLDLVRQLLGQLQSDKSIQFAEEKNPFLSRLRFDLNLETPNGLAIDTNVAELNANADLRLSGDYYRTGIVGRITLEEGGQLRFHERTYLIERGMISFVNETEIEPEPDILATTRVDNYDISLELTGTPDDLKANFTSDPALSQPDIIALLLTGRKLENLQGSGLNVAREQVESYLSGQMAEFLSRNAQEAIGLSLVRIDPSLISPEANPGARLTIGNDITDSLFLIYSMNLVDAGDQILSIEYDITRNFQTKLTRQSDNSYRFELGQALRFGIPKETSSESQSSKKKIDSVEITGNPIFPNEQLLDRFKVKAGDTYDFFKIQKGLEKLEKYYTDRNYLEAKISLKRTEPDSRPELNLQIEAGPEVEMRYLGWNPDKDTKKQVISAWAKGLFDAQRIQNSRQELWSSLAGKGYLEAQIQSKIQSNDSGSKAVVFDMDIGTRYRNVDIEFNGAFGIPPFRLEKALEDEKLIEKIHSAPEETIEFLEKFYRFNGYLNAVVQSFQYELNPDTATGKTIIPIQEGSLFRIHALEFEGNSALTRSQMMEEIPLSPGGVYDPVDLRESVDRIEKLYWSLGYNNVILDYELKRSEEDAGSMKILLRITENSQQYVQEIVVEGNRKTSTSMILSQINLKEGDILDYRETNKSRSHLYDTRAYTFVDIQPRPFSGPQLPSESNRRPVQLKVTVKEVSPFRFVYSSFYDTERGVGGIADFSNRNSLGNARLVGTRVRLDADVQEIRGYFSQPFLRRFPINTDVTGYFRRESTLDEEISNIRFSTDRIGISLQQEVKFQNKFILSYGYRFEHKRQREITSGSVVETIQNTAPLTITLTRESRNNLLDSWKGSLLSQAFEYAPSYLGSDLRYYKYLGQYFYYLPLLSPSRVPWVGEKRSRLVLANGIRVGLAGGFDGQDLLESDKFFAGGGTTIRGFSQNTISPLGPEGEPVGGNALFIVNSELRFPIYSIFDGVGFLDFGNVYSKVGDFDPTDIRSSSGLGLRMRTPYFLLRADYGLKLDRQPGESKGEFFFSIGQAF